MEVFVELLEACEEGRSDVVQALLSSNGGLASVNGMCVAATASIYERADLPLLVNSGVRGCALDACRSVDCKTSSQVASPLFCLGTNSFDDGGS